MRHLTWGGDVRAEGVVWEKPVGFALSADTKVIESDG